MDTEPKTKHSQIPWGVVLATALLIIAGFLCIRTLTPTY